ncbi:MAG: hypothetical protein NT062_04115 [Proteobacteria bacterium]|nr:hypothetical protein [Pseudomonadota bacterium]
MTNKIAPLGPQKPAATRLAPDDDDDDDPEIEIIDDQLVAASEADLLMMARTLLAPAQHDAWSAMCRTRKLPPKIGETCADVLAQTLAQTWVALWRRGGTAPTPGVDGKRGRGWERTPPQPLVFSPTTLTLLRWLVATPLGAPASTLDRLPPPTGPLAIGDQVMIYLALDMASTSPAAAGIARQPLVRATPLAWLGFPHLFDEAPKDTVDFDSLTHGAGAIVVEALAGEIARRWHQIELTKRAITSPEQLSTLGTAQDGVLVRFLAACDRRKRRDLAAFVLDAAAPNLTRRLPPLPAQLDATMSLSARLAARIAAGSLLRAVTTWSAWDQEHRGVRFIDGDYAAVQVLLARFERLGSAGVDLANAWLAELASFAPTPVDPTDATVDRREPRE